MVSTTAENNVECNAQNCLNGGICDHNNNCICARGYFGRDCSLFTTTSQVKIKLQFNYIKLFIFISIKPASTTNGCNPQNCLNGGICDSHGKCICATGYQGHDCSYKTTTWMVIGK